MKRAVEAALPVARSGRGPCRASITSCTLIISTTASATGSRRLALRRARPEPPKHGASRAGRSPITKLVERERPINGVTPEVGTDLNFSDSLTYREFILSVPGQFASLIGGTWNATLRDSDPVHSTRNRKDQRNSCPTRSRQESRREGGRKISLVVFDHGTV